MVLYLSTIVIAMIIISILNITLGSYSFDYSALWVILAVVLSTIVEIAISGVFSAITEHAPEKFFTPDKKLYNVSKKEQKFYEKIGIKSWKDKVWELGALGGFRKNKLNDNTSKYLYRFIIESNRGMLGHIIDLFAGFLVIFILPLKYVWRIGVPVAIVGFILNLLPIFVLRYNLPKLAVAYKRAKRLEERGEKQVAEEAKSDISNNPENK